METDGLIQISEKHNYQSLLEKLKMYGINHYDYDNGKYYCFELENVLHTDYALYENDKLLSIYRNRLELINSHTKINIYIVLFFVGIFLIIYKDIIKFLWIYLKLNNILNS